MFSVILIAATVHVAFCVDILYVYMYMHLYHATSILLGLFRSDFLKATSLVWQTTRSAMSCQYKYKHVANIVT